MERLDFEKPTQPQVKLFHAFQLSHETALWWIVIPAQAIYPPLDHFILTAEESDKNISGGFGRLRKDDTS